MLKGGGALMRRRLLNVLLGIVSLCAIIGVWVVSFCAVIGAPIAILLLLLAPHVGWWGATLEKHLWLVIVLVLIVFSHFVVGGFLSYESRKHQRFLFSPEGKRRRAQEVQESIATIVAEAEARPKLKLDEAVFEGISPSSVMTEARRLARNIAKDELRRRGIKHIWEVDADELTRIANALLEADLNIIGTAKANLEKRAAIHG
jgi:hypothetical protein